MSPVQEASAYALQERCQLCGRVYTYRWNMIHCAVVAMLSWLSLSADSLESTASSVYAIFFFGGGGGGGGGGGVGIVDEGDGERGCWTFRVNDGGDGGRNGFLLCCLRKFQLKSLISSTTPWLNDRCFGSSVWPFDRRFTPGN